MSKELYEKSFPRYIPFGSGKQPLPEGKVLVSGLRTPKYGLGWMVRVPRVKDLNPNYFSLLFNVIWPNWGAKIFKPATQEELERIGYQVPKLWEVGENYAFICVARNHPAMLSLLKSPKNRRLIVRQAVGALGLTPGACGLDTLDNCMWLRWVESTSGFADADYPCIGEQLWTPAPGARSVGPGSPGSGVVMQFPPVERELGALIECLCLYDEREEPSSSDATSE
ncbi:hypothetical protein DFP72DRAFT_887099 [Ephemerocybe angulata]|uniref:Uncharacterized protein n=1 Tax=Ephemerocybe angulata TaxID=980116 RepID=A0A8H6I4V6_9AGAR|nr:hypothetical protein DFP72DRAFT_887099 [Tulosesus angulatus]